MRTPFRYGNRLFSLAGQLLIFPALKDFIADVFGYGWDRNRAIDSKGNHGNALMGGYLLAASNTTITISGLLTTDTLLSLTTNGLVGTITSNNIISFTTGNNYGAFEVYRGNLRIGRYCLTERQELQIINQVTGGLPNGLLGGTTTNVWQRSNAFYCETNNTGYSISGTGWVTSSGAALTVGTIIPADPLNPTKCMARVSNVQQDLQYAGKARNSVSIVPYCAYCNNDRSWNGVSFAGVINTHEIEWHGIIGSGMLVIVGYPYGATGGTDTDTRNRSLYIQSGTLRIKYPSLSAQVPLGGIVDRPIKIVAGFNAGTMYITVTDQISGHVTSVVSTGNPTSITVTAFTSRWGTTFYGYIGSVKETINGNVVLHAILDPQSTNFIDLKNKVNRALVGVSTNLFQNIDLVVNVFNINGYELWTNGTDYQIYPLASDGARIITPAGYTLVETVTAGNMPSIADSRMSTFKYSLANSYEVKQSVPDAFDAADPCAPKLLTYSELSALTNNIKVTKTEVNGKITNLTIRQ